MQSRDLYTALWLAESRSRDLNTSGAQYTSTCEQEDTIRLYSAYMTQLQEHPELLTKYDIIHLILGIARSYQTIARFDTASYWLGNTTH